MVALATLLSRLYGPITSLSNVQVNVMTALVSFDRVFEVLDLKPLIDQSPGARPLPVSGAAPDIEFDHVSFRYPAASEVSLASLESIAMPVPEKTGPVQNALTEVELPRASGQAHRAGRAVGRGQDDHHPPGVEAVRPDQRRQCGSAAPTSAR